MGFFTRKSQRNQALNNARQIVSNVEGKVQHKIKSKHSKVANYLRNPGTFNSVNANRIKKEGEREINKRINELIIDYDIDPDDIRREIQKEKIEPSKIVDAAKELKQIIESEMKSNNDKEITIKISRTLGKILIVILNICIFFTVIFVALFTSAVLMPLDIIHMKINSGVTPIGASMLKFWDWIFDGKWIVDFSSTNSNMKYSNNPLRNKL
jgi:hypothetical protein